MNGNKILAPTPTLRSMGRAGLNRIDNSSPISLIIVCSVYDRLFHRLPRSMKSQRIDIASIRREQIVEAAVAVIAEQGLQNLSLSEIEKKAGMSRGQLTYYFPAKEDILLAVFDHTVALMRAQAGQCPAVGPAAAP